MSDQAVGAFVIFGLLGLALLFVSIFRVFIGMALTSAILGLSGLGIFAGAKTVMHEICGSVFIIGAAFCFGIAGLSRQIDRMYKPAPAVNPPFEGADPPLKRQGWKEPTL